LIVLYNTLKRVHFVVAGGYELLSVRVSSVTKDNRHQYVTYVDRLTITVRNRTFRRISIRVSEVICTTKVSSTSLIVPATEMAVSPLASQPFTQKTASLSPV
jgi:hypothetical protein